MSDRACLTGIIFVLKTGLPWNLLPAELGWGPAGHPGYAGLVDVSVIRADKYDATTSAAADRPRRGG